MMREFGSDFHYIALDSCSIQTVAYYHPGAFYYATGRQALIDVCQQMGWKRIWMPEYFCYEVIHSFIAAGLNISFYTDFPLADETRTICSIPFREGDALFRVNYFGLRSKRSNDGIPVPVVEDHTHDIIGDWAINSDADWCFASLRKTLPLAEGGILWSPKGCLLNKRPKRNVMNDQIAVDRWSAMRKKTGYLEGKISDKSEYRTVMLKTEDQLDSMSVICALDKEGERYLKQLDVRKWYDKKQENWSYLIGRIKSSAFTVLSPENERCNPFSLTLLFDSPCERDNFRRHMIENSIYPAVLWRIPEAKQLSGTDFSRRMLSVHCDARYGMDDIKEMSNIIIG